MSILEKLKKNAGNTINSLGIIADKEVSQKRISICVECENFINLTRQCKKCGCFVDAKTKVKSAECPINKW